MITFLALLSAQPAIAVGIVEVAELSAQSASELANDLTAAITRTTGRAARFDPSLNCPSIEACSGGEELVLLRIFAGAKHVRVIATRGKGGGLEIEETADLPEDLLRRADELDRLALRLFPPPEPAAAQIVPSAETPAATRSSLPFWIAGVSAVAGVAALALAIAAPGRPDQFEQRGVLTGAEYDALRPPATLATASLSLAGGAAIGLAIALFLALD